MRPLSWSDSIRCSVNCCGTKHSMVSPGPMRHPVTRCPCGTNCASRVPQNATFARCSRKLAILPGITDICRPFWTSEARPSIGLALAAGRFGGELQLDRCARAHQPVEDLLGWTPPRSHGARRLEVGPERLAHAVREHALEVFERRPSQGGVSGVQAPERHA